MVITNIHFYFFFLFCLSGSIYSNPVHSYEPLKTAKSILIRQEEWKLTRTKIFKANDLYGHINGGAELFLELGFRQLTVEYFTRDKDELIREIYEMESPESALGIYLFKCGKETPIDEIKARNTGDKFQIMSLKSNCYIAINNTKGKNILLPDMVSLLNITLVKTPDKKAASLFSILPENGLIDHSQFIIRGQYSLQTLYTFGEGDVLLLNGKTFGVTGDYKDKEGNVFTRIIVRYLNDALADKVFSYFGSALDNTKEILKNKNRVLVFKDHANKYTIAKKHNNRIEILINLISNPLDK